MSKTKIQGEGDRESARNFNKESKEFVKSKEGRKEAAKSDHKGESSAEEIARAEKQAAKRAKENDPQATRDYSKPADK